MRIFIDSSGKGEENMRGLKRLLKDTSGSSLVAAVAICAIMAIGVAGLMAASRNTLSQEVDAHNEARVFNAAEGGLHMLAAWVKEAGPANIGAGTDNLTIDGIPVVLELVGLPDFDAWQLRSTADFGGGSAGLAYTKMLSWNLRIGTSADNPTDSVECAVPDAGNPGPNQVVHTATELRAPDWDVGFAGDKLDICVPPEGVTVWIQYSRIYDKWGYSHNSNKGAQVTFQARGGSSPAHCDPTASAGFGGNGAQVVTTGYTGAGHGFPNIVKASWLGGEANKGVNIHREYTANGETRSRDETNECKLWDYNTQGVVGANVYLPELGGFIGPLYMASTVIGQSFVVEMVFTKPEIGGPTIDRLVCDECKMPNPDPNTPTAFWGRWNETNVARAGQ